MTFALDQVVPWGRGLAEYERMFSLTPADFAHRILGCADGPASFNAEATARGARVVSCDPLYQFDADAIDERIAATHPTILSELEANRDAYLWNDFASPADVATARLAAMERFLVDYRRAEARGRYVSAALPHLPFSDGEFGLAVCSHFLFLYAPRIPLDFHVAAVLELCRVARDVRVFPLVDLNGALSPFVDPVRQALGAAGLGVELVRVPYEFQRGADTMLRVSS